MRRSWVMLGAVAALVSIVGCSSAPKTQDQTAPSSQPAPAPSKPKDPVVFASSQLRPVQEAEALRTALNSAPVPSEFVPDEGGPLIDRIVAENKSGKVVVGVVGTLHGDFSTLQKAGALDDVGDVVTKLKDRNINANFLELGKLGASTQYYVPWMQATYLMAANKKALQYLPAGADINTLTYDQLKDWAANMEKGTGQKKLGLPAAPNGLLPRFFQGYFYPSFTGGVVTTFTSPDAERAWQYLKDLWKYASPQSTSYGFMQEPLLSEEVWVAWDHVARLKDAIEKKPNDFVVFPAPAGPKGRGFMPVLVGVAITKGAPSRDDAVALVEYLAKPETQAAVLKASGFFPVVAGDLPSDLSEGLRLLAGGVQKQTNAKDALVSLLPVGLGAKGGEFNKVYTDTFTRIVLRNEDIKAVLKSQAANLAAIFKETGAPCWRPDPVSQGACEVK